MHTPITLYGYTGTHPHDHLVEAAEIARGADAHERHLGQLAFAVVRYHNTLLPHANTELLARQAATTAVAIADHAYEALSCAPTAGWLAAHHRWLNTYPAVCAALTHWQKAHDAFVQAQAQLGPLREDELEFYRGQVPEDNRIGRPADPREAGQRWHAEYEARQGVAAQTVRLLAPAPVCGD